MGLRAVVLAGAILTCSHADAGRTGEIALSDSPSCQFFVIAVKSGFSLTWWRGGFHLFAEGDAVFGPADRPGRHVIVVDAHPGLGEVPTEVDVEIERVEPDLGTAQETFYRRCHS